MERKFGKEPCLAAARFAFHDYQRPLSLASMLNLFDQLFELVKTAYKRGLGESGVMIARAHNQGRLAFAATQCIAYVLQIGFYGFG